MDENLKNELSPYGDLREKSELCPKCGRCPTCGRAAYPPYWTPLPTYPTQYYDYSWWTIS